MGFFNDAATGYKTLKNTKGLTNEYFYPKLCEANLSFGTPELGTIKILGKESEAVVIHYGKFDVYVKANSKKIEVARVYGQNTSKALNVAAELAISTVSNAQGIETAHADRAVDELFDVVQQIVETGSGRSRVVQSSSEDNDSSALYMDQKIFSIRDKFNIYTEDHEPVYQVQGSITGLSIDVKTADGEVLYTIKKKLVAITPEYTIFKGKEKIGTVKKKITLGRPELNGEIKKEKLLIKGDTSGFHFSIDLGGKIIGSVDTRRLEWGDCYLIESNDPSYEKLSVIVAVICNNSLQSGSSDD